MLQAWLATISLALCKAFDLLDMLKKEEEMLLAVKERQEKVMLMIVIWQFLVSGI